MVWPWSQWFGRGFGHNGSTSNRGATTPAASTAALFCKNMLATMSVPSSVRKIAPTYKLRFMPPPYRDQLVGGKSSAFYNENFRTEEKCGSGSYSPPF